MKEIPFIDVERVMRNTGRRDRAIADMQCFAMTHSRQLGHPIFPCHVNQSHHVKELAPEGYKSASINLEQIARWWATTPWNIAIATGSIVVLQVNPNRGGIESFDKLIARCGKLSETWIVAAPNGTHHIYFDAPSGDAIGCSIDCLGPGISVFGHGGYVLGMGSIHYSGFRYSWYEGYSPIETPRRALMPNWLAALCRIAGAAHSTDGGAA